MKIPTTIVELVVNNHAGVMSHVTGLFSRRSFNMEAILCAPVGDGETSRMYLLVNRDERLPQITKQLEKLYDVQSVRVRDDADHTVFARIEELLTGK
ncbi:MAG: acetolactate synthase small subunit [Spirochaetaceae bacterium]|nr:MAG: acetolactate synthase small subunit [Spirochaetaceae bacterium]